MRRLVITPDARGDVRAVLLESRRKFGPLARARYRLLIETDSPYLAPVPYRGKLNNPSYVPFVAKLLGELRGSTSQAIGELTTLNFLKLFAKTAG